jgi:hypothetical protein
MTDQNFNQNANTVYHPHGPLLFCLALMIVVAGFILMGCAGQTGASKVASAKPVVKLYAVSEQEALDLAKWAVERALPNQKVLPLKKPRIGLLVHETVPKGIVKYARFNEAVFIYEIDLYRMLGSTSQGQRIVGYTYAVKGDGDLKTGPENLVRIGQQLQEAFEQTGRAVAVSSSRPHTICAPVPQVTSPSQAPKPQPSTIDQTTKGMPGEKPAATQSPAVVPVAPVPDKEPPAKAGDVFTKLKKLKKLRDQGIITEEEFRNKKKELLDRI